MSKNVIAAFALFAFLFFAATSLAGERVVQLNLSGCAECNSSSRAERILKKTKGVINFENKGHGMFLVAFNDETTTLNIIISELKKGKLFVEGETIFLK